MKISSIILLEHLDLKSDSELTVFGKIFSITYLKCCLFLFFVFVICSCGHSPRDLTQWSSEYRHLSFEYSFPWSKLPGLDTRGKTISGITNKRNGESYIIQITDDVSKQQLSDVDYLFGVRQNMLADNDLNRVIAESDTVYHGIKAHRMDFILHTGKWGVLQDIYYVIRTGKECVSVQILFPIAKANRPSPFMPMELEAFDHTVNLAVQ